MCVYPWKGFFHISDVCACVSMGAILVWYVCVSMEGCHASDICVCVYVSMEGCHFSVSENWPHMGLWACGGGHRAVPNRYLAQDRRSRLGNK